MAIALVANVARTSGGTSGSITTTGANFIAISVGNVSGNPTGVSDNKSNTYTCVGITPFTGGMQSLWVSVNPTVGAGHTFTVSGNFPSFCVAAFSGVETVFALSLPAAKNNTTATSIQAGSLTPTVNNALVIAGLAYRDTTTVSINGGFTITNQNPFSSGIAAGSALAYLVQTSAAAANPTWSWTNSVVCAATLTVFQPPMAVAGGGGGAAYAFAG